MAPSFYVKHWAVKHPSAVINLVHGAAEYVSRYNHLAEKLMKANFAVVGTDFPGHGQSGGERGHINHFSDYIQTINHTFDIISENYPGVPVILLGHSMGGLAAIRYLQLTKSLPDTLIATILSSPCLGLSMKISKFMSAIAGSLDAIVPKLRQSNGIKAIDLTRSPAAVKRHESDDQIVKTVTIHWFQELRKGIADANLATHTFPIPVLICQAGSDKIVSAESTKRFYQQMTAPEQKLIQYPECYHELFNEPERDHVIQDILTWLAPILANAQFVESPSTISPEM